MDSLQKQIVEGNKGLRKNAERVAEQRIVDECAGKKLQLVYNNLYSQAYEKELEKVKGFKWERDVLEVDLFVCSNQPLADNIKEFWSDDMVEYFERVNEEKENDKINGHWCDVDEGSNATASFMAHNDVSNIHDDSMAEKQGDQVMHFEVVIIPENMKCFISYIYAENTCKDRRLLWKNLVDHMAIIGSSPWALLGDFNVSLSFGESMVCFILGLKRGNPKLGILKKLDRVMGNGAFVHNFSGSYSNFLPYLASDHCPTLLVLPDVQTSKPKSFRFMNFLAEKDNFLPTVRQNWNVEVKGFCMFVLVKRFKNIKKCMRKLNKDNGNVFEKAKFLKAELKRVQLCLDKDPHNALLREEELIYSKAYHDVAVDEERLIK
ncbi:RNA-directed DNA polymerase, eukaryota, reverse transcriptase zinc-binding domain protein [Tanacetum coccineum]